MSGQRKQGEIVNQGMMAGTKKTMIGQGFLSAASPCGAGRQKQNRKHSGKAAAPGILKRLFFSTLYLSAFTFGGGYVIVTLLKEQFVDRYHWIDEEEMMDLIAIAQSSPGAVAVNGAIVVGYKLAGIPGVIISVLGAVLPPMVLLSLISVSYSFFKSNEYIQRILAGMTVGVGAVITSVVYDMGKSVIASMDIVNIAIMAGVFLAGCFFSISTVWIILAAAACGVIRTLIPKHKKGRKPQAPQTPKAA